MKCIICGTPIENGNFCSLHFKRMDMIDAHAVVIVHPPCYSEAAPIPVEVFKTADKGMSIHVPFRRMDNVHIHTNPSGNHWAFETMKNRDPNIYVGVDFAKVERDTFVDYVDKMRREPISDDEQAALEYTWQTLRDISAKVKP